MGKVFDSWGIEKNGIGSYTEFNLKDSGEGI
jgi:hypothetical protein